MALELAVSSRHGAMPQLENLQTQERKEEVSTINDGGPAFPNAPGYEIYYGMTLRDYFAAAALQGLLASGHFTTCRQDDSPEGDPWLELVEDDFDDDGKELPFPKRRVAVAEAAWKAADAMLAERERTTKPVQ
jgi:hypothetical protein